MTKIEKIWEDLENDTSLTTGLLYRRYSGKISPDVYVALKVPERHRSIAVHLNKSSGFDTKAWDKFRDIKIQGLQDEKNKGRQFLIISLLNNQHRDIFSILSEDLIRKVSDISDENALVSELISRLEKWHLLFEKLNCQGLSEEAQRGLYGELYFLKEFLKTGTSPEFCVDTWKGAEKEVQDFQHADWAVEVKTTHGKNQQKLHISNERQLDTSLVPYIYLIHLSLEIRQGFGESLNSLVESLDGLLIQSPAAYSVFKLKLLEAGYFDHQIDLYEDTGYSIRQENFYKVVDDFPRITESMILPGVGDVKYSVIISANESWIIDKDQLFSLISKPN